jgi:predicted transglutaminase-like cysteine proteinase
MKIKFVIPLLLLLAGCGVEAHDDRVYEAWRHQSPINYSDFCKRYEDDCKVVKNDYFKITPVRLNELDEVNKLVNDEIEPSTGPKDQWDINPKIGNCHDYVMTKRHDLIQKGWPSSRLIVTEVVTHHVDVADNWHLVLLVDIDGEYVVLNNLEGFVYKVKDPHYSHYIWITKQSASNPNEWVPPN